MKVPHLVRVGLFGQVERFDALGCNLFARYDDVICRTPRGLEVGTVLCPISSQPSLPPNGSPIESMGQLLRKVTADDRMIIERIERFRDKAFEACRRIIQQRGIAAVLVDVEHLFDGQSLYFYFLGDVPSEVAELTHQLALEYEKKVRFKKFAETLAQGCGPDCGTKDSQCGSGNCGSCTVRGSCKS